jgi:mycothiol system anti-sigma-R factor
MILEWNVGWSRQPPRPKAKDTKGYAGQATSLLDTPDLRSSMAMDEQLSDPGRDGQAGGENCQEALRTLYYFLDGELTPQRREAIQQHLDKCSPCLEAFDFEAELKLIIGRCCRDQVPESLRHRVAEVLAEASGMKQKHV